MPIPQPRTRESTEEDSYRKTTEEKVTWHKPKQSMLIKDVIGFSTVSIGDLGEEGMGCNILNAEVYIKEDHHTKSHSLAQLSRVLVIRPLLPSGGTRIAFSHHPLPPYLSSSYPELLSVLQVCCALPRL